MQRKTIQSFASTTVYSMLIASFIASASMNPDLSYSATVNWLYLSSTNYHLQAQVGGEVQISEVLHKAYPLKDIVDFIYPSSENATFAVRLNILSPLMCEQPT